MSCNGDNGHAAYERNQTIQQVSCCAMFPFQAKAHIAANATSESTT